MLYLAIKDLKTPLACQLVDDVSSSTLRKKRPSESNRIFLMALANGMENVCIMMLDKGFPANLNGSIVPASFRKDGFVYPSYFLVSVALGLDSVVRFMLKVWMNYATTVSITDNTQHRADVNDTWYGLSALHLAAIRGNIVLFQKLLDNGADTTKTVYLHVLGLLKTIGVPSWILGREELEHQVLRQRGSTEPAKAINADFLKDKMASVLDFVCLSGNADLIKIAAQRCDASHHS